MADSTVENSACSHSVAKNEADIVASNATHNDANIIRLSDGLSVDLASLTDPRFVVLYRGKRRYIYYQKSDFNIYMKSFVEEILHFKDPSDARLLYLRTFLAFFAYSICNIKNVCNDEQVSNLVDKVDKTISVNYPTCNTYKYIFGGMVLKLDDSVDLELSGDGLEIRHYSSNIDAIFNALTAEIKQIAKMGEKLLNSDELSSKNKLFYAFSAGVISASRQQFSDDMPASVKMQRFILQKLAGEFYRFNDSPHDTNRRIGVFAVGNKYFRANYGTSAVLVRADSVVSAYYRILNAYDTNIDTVEGYESGLTPLRKTESIAYFSLSDYNCHKIIFVKNTPDNADAAAEAIKKRRAIFHSLGFKLSSVSDIVFLKNGMKNSVLASKNDIISIDYSDIAEMVAKMPKKQAPKTPKTVGEVKSYIFEHSTSCVAVSFSNVPSSILYNVNGQFATNILPETKMPLCRIFQTATWNTKKHYIALDKDSFNKLKLGVSVVHRQKGSNYSNGKMVLNIITQAMLKNGIIPNYSDLKHPTEICFFSYHAVKSAECVKYLKAFVPITEISENYVVDDDMRLKLDEMAAILADFELKTMVLNVFKHCNSIIGYDNKCLMKEDNGCYSYNKIAGINLFKLLYNSLTERYNTGKYAKNKIIEGFYDKLRTIVEYYDNSVSVFENKDYKALLTDEILKIMELFLFSCQKWGYSIPEKHIRKVKTTITTLISYMKSMFSDYLELEFQIAEICSDVNSRSVINEDELKKHIDALAYYCQKASYDPSLADKIGKTRVYSGNVLKDDNLPHLCIDRKYNTLCYGQEDDMSDAFFKNISRRVWEHLRTVVSINDPNIIDNLEADFADFQLFYTEHKYNVIYRDYDNSNAQNYLCFYNLARLFQQFGDSPYPYEYNKQAIMAKMPEILPFISTAFCNVPKIY